jgi:hemerythrin superfamily protein
MNSLKKFMNLAKFTKFGGSNNRLFKMSPKYFINKNDNIDNSSKSDQFEASNMKRDERAKDSTSCDNKNSNQSSSNEDKGKSGSSGGMSGLQQGMAGISHMAQQVGSKMGDTLNYVSAPLTEKYRSLSEPIDEMILIDHQDLRAFYKKFEESTNNEESHKWLCQLMWEIARHSHAEELILYPMLKNNIDHGSETWTKSLNQHREVKVLLSQIEKLKDMNEIKSKVKALFDVLEDHMKFEENDVLPQFSKNVSKEQRVSAGNSFLRRKMIVPTRPHTMAPDSIPTLESLVGLLLAPVDKFKDIIFGDFPNQQEVNKIKKENAENIKDDKSNKNL